ncbi:GNAT family N-acetyltransferase [Oxobacter pfennigii]|nr:GNAT family N-acetyltransferase [Oxobacter pfennigii]
MLSLFIKDGNLTIKDIEKKQLSVIAQWLNGSNIQYKYSMGINKPITLEEVNENYLETLINAHEFFLSININEQFIGFVKGRIDYRDEGEVWIMSLLIDRPYQNNGLGKKILDLLTKEFNDKLDIKNFYACIVNDSIHVKYFWEKNGFNVHRVTKGYFTIDDKNYDLVILHKQYKKQYYRQKMVL